MKKKHLLILVLITIGFKGFSQDYVKKIANKTCECANKIPDSVSNDTYNMQLGVCMIASAKPYKKKLKKDFDIDFNHIDTQAEQLGELIGMQMIGSCPNTMIEIARRNEEPQIEEVSLNIQGKIVNIEENQFVFFLLKDGTGKTKKFIWLSYIESDIDLFTDYKEMKSKAVSITYKKQELYDPRIGEYRNYNIIISIEKLRSSTRSTIGML